MIKINHKITPDEAIKMSFCESRKIIKNQLGEEVYNASFQSENFYPSPLSKNLNTNWSKTSKIIGVNPRLTETYWGIVKYSLTFPENAIHIMPLWETGDKDSLYVQNSWKLNDEFLDGDLVNEGFDTCEKQLKLVVNVLHAMGKTVGFDALPHVDNFSEITLANPQLFEWVKLNESRTSQLFPPAIDYNLLHLEVEQIIIEFLKINGDSLGQKIDESVLKNIFNFDFYEEERIKILFGTDKQTRFDRRISLMKFIRSKKFEVVPVTEHAPSRPVIFDKIESNRETEWATFKVDNMAPMAKIIGCITPYKWYLIDNQGYPIHNTQNNPAWNYFIEKISTFQQEFNFDFLRADMAHNQISHSHIDKEKNLINEIEMWAKLKDKIQEKSPYFATLAEAFYNFYYIDGFQDMMNKKFDVILGDLNFKYLNKEYLFNIDDYINVFRKNFSFHPCVTIITNDADSKANDNYFLSPLANEIRVFTALFLNLPSYMGMGLETRNLISDSEEFYSSKYVKYQPVKYKWGTNYDFFETLTKMRAFYDEIRDIIDHQELIWLKTENDYTAAWIYLDNDVPSYLFALNIDTENFDEKVCCNNLFNADKKYIIEEVLTNSRENESPTVLKLSENNFEITNIHLGEFKVLKFITQ